MSELENTKQELEQLRKELEQANLAQSRFLANISHEIRTPLGGIMGYADQLLFDSSLQTQQRDTVVALKRCANHLMTLIGDLLDLSKIEAGKSQVQCVEFNFLHLLHEVASVMEARIRDKNLKFKILFQTLIPEIIYSDPLRIRQILINILGNAVKFTDKGLITLQVAAKGFSDHLAGTIVLAVSDTGRGILPEFKDELFKRFSQADHSFNRKSSGSGLGLYLSKNLAQQLGGDLQLVETIPNEGSVFQCAVVAKVAEGSRFLDEFIPASSFRKTATDIKMFEGKLENLAILLVEDGLDNQRIFSYFLRLAGATVTIEKDGARALQRIWAQADFDIILMDIQLPVMDGYAVTEELRKNGFTKPIIAVTAHALAEEKNRCLETGFSDFLSKPVEIEKLIETVMQHTRRSGSAEVSLNSPQPLKVPLSERAPEPENGLILSKYHQKAVYQQMIMEFVNGLDGRLAESSQLIQKRRWDELSRMMHQLKGAAATYGYGSLSEVAGKLENSAKLLTHDAQVHDHITAQADEIRQLCSRMKAGLSLLEARV